MGDIQGIIGRHIPLFYGVYFLKWTNHVEVYGLRNFKLERSTCKDICVSMGPPSTRESFSVLYWSAIKLEQHYVFMLRKIFPKISNIGNLLSFNWLAIKQIYFEKLYLVPFIIFSLTIPTTRLGDRVGLNCIPLRAAPDTNLAASIYLPVPRPQKHNLAPRNHGCDNRNRSRRVSSAAGR